jgi:hypothetical protein
MFDLRYPVTLLVGLLLLAWLVALPAASTFAAPGDSASLTTSAVDTAPEYLRAPVTLDGKVLRDQCLL